MNTSRFLWGLLIIVFGVLLLGNSLGWWSTTIWAWIGHWWPLLLILLGIRLFIGEGALFALISLLVIIAVIASYWVFGGSKIGMFPARFTMANPMANQDENNQNATNNKIVNFSQSLAVESTETLVVDLSGRYEVKLSGDDSQNVAVDLTGPESVINGISLRRSGSKVVLTDDGSMPHMGWFWLNWTSETVKGTITLPKALAAELRPSGLVKLTGDQLNGKILINSSGAGAISIMNSTVVDPDIDLSGAGSIELDKVSGMGKLSLSGAGKIMVKGGTLDKLDADTSGAGSIELGSVTVKDAKLRASGVGGITLTKPIGSVDQQTSGASKIYLK